MSEEKRRETIRFKTNPFLEELVINKKSRQVKVSNGLGKDDNVLMNQSTGEVRATSVVTYKSVDDAEFIKIFSANIALIFDLNKAGYKVLTLLVWAVQKHAIGRDIVRLNAFTLEDFLKDHDVKAFSKPVFKRGLTELEDAKIIAKTLQAGDYFINPSFIFNGDRIAFTQVIERKKSEDQQKETNKKYDDQLNLLND
jgi:hypothetical protein